MAAIEDLYEAVKRRECILFLGAGVHYPPPENSDYAYPPESRPPLGAGFSRQLTDECLDVLEKDSKEDATEVGGVGEEARERAEHEHRLREEQRAKRRWYLQQHRESLQRSSWYFEVHRQRAELIRRIVEAVDQGKQPSPIVRALATIDFPIVITTNYDRLFEGALGLLGKKVAPIIYNPERHEPEDLFGLPRKDQRWIFKIHGCISKPDSIVITDEDYIRFVMRMNDGEDFHPVPQKIRTQLAEWPTLFVGYSLLDYNLRLLFRTLRWRIKPALRPATFSLDLHPDLLVQATYGVLESQLANAPLVTFIARDIWSFVPQLYEQVLGERMPG
jgi:hypothetical protein